MTATSARGTESRPDGTVAARVTVGRGSGADEPKPLMSVETVGSDATRALIRVTGELDISTAAPLWAVLEGHRASGRRFLRLDLSGVSFLDATALTGIVTTHKELLASRGTLVITGVRPLVSRVLRMTSLDEVLFIGGRRADYDTFDGLDQDELDAADVEDMLQEPRPGPAA